MSFSGPWFGLSALRMRVRTLLLGPQILAFLPAVMLGGFWMGGEVALLLLAILLPGALGFAGLFSTYDDHGVVPRDGTTGLPLRSTLEHFLEGAVGKGGVKGQTSAAFAVAIDDYDTLAKRIGAAAQEKVLVMAAKNVMSALRDDDCVVRLEGPKIGIGLSPVRQCDLEALIQMSSRIMKAFEAPTSIGGLRVYVSVSVGFCSKDRAVEPTGKNMLESAICALDEAQACGMGTVRAFSPEMQQRVKKRGSLASELSSALDAGAICAWFQPQVSTDTGDITGFEALARWVHPDRGTISPNDFLPLVEASGLSQRLSEVMLYNSLSALCEWDRSGLGIPTIGVNFSADELRDPQLVDKLAWELDRFELTPERLAIEVLETVIADSDNDVIVQNLSALSELGCNIDLDDFGTGHASIGNIRRFHVNRIKIDRSFVTNVDADRDQQGLVSAILTLAERLELETLAEGVETIGEHAILAQLGCGHIQGYSIAQPMPFSATVAWTQEHRAKIARTEGTYLKHDKTPRKI